MAAWGHFSTWVTHLKTLWWLPVSAQQTVRLWFAVLAHSSLSHCPLGESASDVHDYFFLFLKVCTVDNHCLCQYLGWFRFSGVFSGRRHLSESLGSKWWVSCCDGNFVMKQHSCPHPLGWGHKRSLMEKILVEAWGGATVDGNTEIICAKTPQLIFYLPSWSLELFPPAQDV